MHLFWMQRAILFIIHSSKQLYNELQTENISLIMDTDEDTVLTGTGNDGKLYSISRSEKDRVGRLLTVRM